MKNNRTIGALVALALGLGMAPRSVVAAPGCHVPHDSSDLRWSVVRVAVEASGSVRSERVVWHSGNRAFDSTALRVVAATSFAPNRPDVRAASAFDEVVTSACGAKPRMRIAPIPDRPFDGRAPAFHAVEAPRISRA